MSDFKRLTEKAGNEVVLPKLIIPNRESQQDMENYHEAMRDIELKIMRLSDYEDTGRSPSEVTVLDMSLDDLKEACKVSLNKLGLLLKSRDSLLLNIKIMLERQQNCKTMQAIRTISKAICEEIEMEIENK